MELKNEKSPIYWMTLSFVVGFLFVAPFYKGLFNGYVYDFERPIFVAIMCSAAVMLVFLWYIFKAWNSKELSRRDFLVWIVWLIPFSYLISSFGAASQYYAKNELFVKILWAMFFSFGAYLSVKEHGRKVLQYALAGSGYLLVIYGFANWFENAKYTEAVLAGNRLSNVFQYPNTYAAYLVALYVCSLVLFNASTNARSKFLFAAMLTPVSLSLLLTLSRAALLFLPAVLLLYLFCLRVKEQLMTMIDIAVSFGLSIGLYGAANEIRAQLLTDYSLYHSLKGWAIVAVSSMAAGALIFLINKFFFNKQQENDRFKLVDLVIPAVLLLIAVAGIALVLDKSPVLNVLPEDIRVRVEGLSSESSSVYQRNSFYKDALKIINDYPLTGAGGAAWSVLYDSYKSYPYTSTQAHNFFVQYAVETGILGISALMIFLILWLLVIAKNIRMNRFSKDWPFFPFIIICILAHSLIDFDMSYVYVSSIVFLALGASVSTATQPVLTFNKPKTATTAKSVFVGLIAVISFYLFVKMALYTDADKSFANAREKALATSNYSQFKGDLDTALRKNPHHPAYNLFRASVLHQLQKSTGDARFQSELEDTIRKIRESEPYNREIIEFYYWYLVDSGQFELALKLSEEVVKKFPWELELYERTIELYVMLGAERNGDAAIALSNQLLERRAHIDTLPGYERYKNRDFTITNRIASKLAVIQYAREQYDKVVDLLSGFVPLEIQSNLDKEIARYYVAASRKLGIDAEDLYSKLIAADPNEMSMVESLLR